MRTSCPLYSRIHRASAPSRPARPASLVVALQVLGHVVVDDEAHVRLVDPHPESVGSHHHLDPVEEEVLLILLPLLRLQPGVVAGCGDAGALEELADLLHVLPGGAVDDAALPRPLPHPGQQLHPLYGGAAHLQIQVVPVKPGGDGQGASSSSSRWISSRTSEVAVAVKAPTTGLWGSRSTKSGMFR